MGWGVNATNDVLSDMLLKLEQQLFSDEDCHKQTGMNTVDMTYMCAGGEEGGSPSIGDSGGPLILENFNGDDVLISLVSSSLNISGAKRYPTYYLRFSSLLDWIDTAIDA
ncbi:unnamed protein product [Peronospora farinosa]|nr:unnamed protein product [Peronospora farinosa]CAI5724732.1 unnamed protein product [Peronospora farinosa]